MNTYIPRFMFMQIVRGCNLRCTHCDFYKLDESPHAMSIDQQTAIIKEFSELSRGLGVVVTCGGEPALAHEKYYAMAKAAHQSNLRMFSVMNGTMAKTLDGAKKLLVDGADEISISLDAPDEDLHDKFRGVKGAFKLATTALRNLVQARQELKLNAKRIYSSTILCNSLHGRIDEFFQLVLRDIGADKLKLNIIEPTFNTPDRDGHIDPYFEEEHIQDIEKLVEEISLCDVKYGIKRNPVWLDHLKMYAKSIASARAHKSLRWSTLSSKTTEHICNSQDRNIMVGDLRMMRLCFGPQFPGMVWEKTGDMHHFWHEFTMQWRGEMARCNRLCAISHSHHDTTSVLSEQFPDGVVRPRDSRSLPMW